MTWQKYERDIQNALKENPVIRDTVDKMIRDGCGKDEIMRITGAPYEVVDSRMARIERGNTGQTDSDRREYVENLTAKKRGRPRKNPVEIG